MSGRSKRGISWSGALNGGALCAAFGLGLLWWVNRLVFGGYDLLFLFPTGPAPQEAVIVYMDGRSFNELEQTTTPAWDLNLHAKLLDRLTDDGARVVVFDIVFDSPAPAAARSNFARAIRRNGRVVVAAALDQQARPQGEVKGPVFPADEILEAAAGWGIAEVNAWRSETVRQYYPGDDRRPSLPWTAAVVAGAVSAAERTRPRESWLKYYGPALSLPHISYCDVSSQPPGFFRGKAVFVGALPKTLRAHDEADVLRTPHRLWGEDFFPGVEIGATAYLNFVRGDGLSRWPWAWEIAFVLVAGFVFGAVLSLVRPWMAVVVAVAGFFLLFAGARQVARQGGWFGWTVVALGQVPCALVWSVRGHFQRLRFEKELAERTLAETSRWAQTAVLKPPPRGLVIPDHALVRRVGQGAYGEVWLARNAVGAYHAVKILRRNAFPKDEPYEREFKGIQKFMPISRSHPGFVHVLHVGRNDEEGYFYCIMEAGDDQTTGQKIDPEVYAPRTLASLLAWRGKLPPEECRQVGLALAAALEHLHRHQLVHRDIKPGNIIFVNGAPKFADIGLVTEIRGEGRDVSLVGTEGYLAPEGPGAPGADVYALGKVLYEASMGRDRRLFPEVPTAVLELGEDALLRRLNDVIGKACATDPRERYASARELHDALLDLQPEGGGR